MLAVVRPSSSVNFGSDTRYSGLRSSPMPDTPDYTAQNRRAWNEIAELRHQKWPDAEFFAAGGSLLHDSVLAAAGDVRGLALLHLQCATGEDTLSWAVA